MCQNAPRPRKKKKQNKLLCIHKTEFLVYGCIGKKKYSPIYLRKKVLSFFEQLLRSFPSNEISIGIKILGNYEKQSNIPVRQRWTLFVVTIRQLLQFLWEVLSHPPTSDAVSQDYRLFFY